MNSSTQPSACRLCATSSVLPLLSALWGGCLLAFANPVAAQITPDNTLPNNSVVNTSGSRQTISGGTHPSGSGNLFHSFREFSVPTGGTAFFDNAADIRNIFTRVTGSSASNIDGLIQANGSANLFLLNPNGILFGPNARLDIGGSFVGSTASAIRFGDGFQFAATDTSTPLLTVSAPVGLRVGPNPGAITINNQPASGQPDFTNPGLQVDAGHSLTLAGGDIRLNGGRLTALGGQIALAGLAEAGTIGLDGNFQLSPPAGVTRANVSLSNGSFVGAAAPRPLTSLTVQARNLELSQGSTLLSVILPSGQPGFAAGKVEIDASEAIRLNNGNIYSIITEGASGITGDIDLRANRFLITGGGRVGVSLLGRGRAGDVNLTADRVTIDGTGSRLLEAVVTGVYSAVLDNGIGNAGDVNINARTVALINGGIISASTLGRGNGGDVNIRTSEAVSVDGITPGFVGIASLIGSTVEEAAVGDGGSVNIFAPLLRLSRGGTVLGRVTGQGNGGDINLRLDRLEGRSGGQIATTSQANGNAGDINLNVRDQIFFTGRDATYEQRTAIVGDFSRYGGASSGLYADVAPGAIGTGGDLRVQTPELVLQAGAQISASSRGQGDSGSVAIQVDQARFSNRANITVSNLAQSGDSGNLSIRASTLHLDRASLQAEASSGSQGNLQLDADLISLDRGSRISTNSTGSATGGNISLSSNYLIALDNSDITANSTNSFGGSVSIASQAVIGTQFRSSLTSTSDITASSARGAEFSGTVELQTPEVKPGQGVIEFPETVIDPSAQVTAACDATSDNRFVVTGRGGLPADPNRETTGSPSWADLRDLSQFRQATQADRSTAAAEATEASQAAQLIEASGWRVNAAGQHELVATAVARPDFQAANCSGSSSSLTSADHSL